MRDILRQTLPISRDRARGRRQAGLANRLAGGVTVAVMVTHVEAGDLDRAADARPLHLADQSAAEPGRLAEGVWIADHIDRDRPPGRVATGQQAWPVPDATTRMVPLIAITSAPASRSSSMVCSAAVRR